MKTFNNLKTHKKYQLNAFQWFVVDQDGLAKELKKITYPALALDTEFFNQSHQKISLTEQSSLIKGSNKSLIYVLQYAILNKSSELKNLNKEKKIKNLKIHRRFNDPQYDFFKQQKKLINNFLKILVKYKIKTLILAGANNDRLILENWMNQNRQLLKKYDLKVLKITSEKMYELKIVDIYCALEKTMAFVNYKKDGSEFYKVQNLKPGFIGTNTLQLPSLKKFFEYMEPLYPKFLYEDHEDIYQLSKSALEFFSLPEMSWETYCQLNEKVKRANRHCFNDVYKLLELLYFCYECLQVPTWLKNLKIDP